MKYNKLLIVSSLLAVGLASSCSDDWDDHYKSASFAKGEGSLWEALSANPELSNFQAVIAATGYQAQLESSQIYTVFAPTNNRFTETQRDSVIALYQAQKQLVKDKYNDAIVEFVKNHIMLYNYSVTTGTNDSIEMLNGKHVPVTATKFAGHSFVGQQTHTNNGTLYVLDDMVAYEPNVYEYLSRDADFDSVSHYIEEFSIDRFVASKSVPGEIVDGVQKYLDSVTVFENEVLDKWLNAELNNEDSLYWMVPPTNEIWAAQVPVLETYYQYDELVNGRDSMMYNFPRMSLLWGTTFSEVINAEYTIADSILSTNGVPYKMRRYYWGSYDLSYYEYYRPYDEGGVFYGTSEISCSNGRILKPSVWNFDPYQTYIRKSVSECESLSSLDSVRTATTQTLSRVVVSADNPFYKNISQHAYAVISPKGSSNAEAIFQMYNILSNVPYDIDVIVVPASAGDTMALNLPTQFRAELHYHNAAGNDIATRTMVRPTTIWTTTGTQVDTIRVGEKVVIPTCSYSLSEAQVKLKLTVTPTAAEENNGKFTRTLRVDKIVFTPHQGE